MTNNKFKIEINNEHKAGCLGLVIQRGGKKKETYLEFIEKLADNEDESALVVSLPDAPPIVLLLTALVQLAA